MGERATIDQDYLYGAADAIRRKNGTSNTYTPDQFETAIDAIPTGINPTGTINITENGDVDVTVYATAHVAVSGGGGGATILSGTAEPTAAQGSDGDIYLQYVNGVDVFGNPTSNTPDNGSISATSTYSLYSPFKAFGNNDGWGANGGSGTLTYTFTSDSFRPVSLSFIDYFDVSGGYLKANTFTFEGSNDGSTWDTLYTKSDAATTKDTVKTVTIETQNTYNRFRLVVSGGSGYAGIKNVVCIGSDAYGRRIIVDTFCKASGAWQDLIGSDIDDVGGVTA